MRQIFLLSLLICISVTSLAQDISLFQQFNGHYSYVAIGNTLNEEENSTGPCTILTSSSAPLALEPQQEIVAAYLYWAGSGPGDFEVSLNGNTVTAERTFSYNLNEDLAYFGAMTDVTNIVTSIGNGLYTLSEFDITNDIQRFCANSTNFGGWSITIVYQDDTMPLNQVKIFDGFEGVSALNNTLTIELLNLNVLDNTGARIGFLAWEGDLQLANNETLSVNGNIISNPPLNPADNAFNSTNSFTNSAELYNMDIDFYNIENNISPGDTNATITLTSDQDLVIVNNIITVLNTELPDATIEITATNGATTCGDRTLDIDYTVFNENSTGELPANTPITFYANTSVIGQTATQNTIPINGSENGTITVTIPAAIPADFQLIASVDDTGNGTGIVNESNEDNNTFELDFHLLIYPTITQLDNLIQCDVFGVETFSLFEAITTIDPDDTIQFFESEVDALANDNSIQNTETYTSDIYPQTIYVRVENPDCYIIESFIIDVIDCALPDATIQVTSPLFACRQRALRVEYTVYNTDATAPLPSQTPIAIYVDGILWAQTETETEIPINGEEQGWVDLELTDDVPDSFTLLLWVDDIGNGTGIVFELNDVNNTTTENVSFGSIPPITLLPDLEECDTGFDTATFDLTVQDDLISDEETDTISYFISIEDAIANTNAIAFPESYQSTENNQVIYVRLENEICFATASFLLKTTNCPPKIPEGFSPNGDGVNDFFAIEWLLDVYPNFNLKIFTRNGNLIYEGGNEDRYWDGYANKGLLVDSGLVPPGTYYYVLHLNDPEFPEPFIHFVYINY